MSDFIAAVGRALLVFGMLAFWVSAALVSVMVVFSTNGEGPPDWVGGLFIGSVGSLFLGVIFAFHDSIIDGISELIDWIKDGN